MLIFGGQGCRSTGLSVWVVREGTSLRKTTILSPLHFQISVLIMQKWSAVINQGLKCLFSVANDVVVQD